MSLLTLLLLVLLTSVAKANWLWLPREQVTQSADSLAGAATQGTARGDGSGVSWHVTLRTWESNPNRAIGYYIPVGQDWDVAGAWQADRESVTFFEPDSGHRSTDIDIAVDDAGDIYLVAEIFKLAIAVADTNDPRIGFRHRTSGGWGPQYILSQDPDSLGVLSPNIFLEEGGASDTLHVSFWERDEGLWYTRKATSQSDDAWEDPVFVTDMFERVTMRVDDDGFLHFFGKRTGSSQYADSAFVWDLFGKYAEGEWVAEDSVLVSTHVGPRNQSSLEPESSPPVGDIEQAGEEFHWVWAAPTAGTSSGTSDLFTATRSALGVWSTRDTVTVIDSSSAYTAELDRSENGTWHIVYVEPGRFPLLTAEPTNHTEIRHISSEDFETWSYPETVSFEQRTVSGIPKMLCVEDTLLVTYTSHDDDHPTPETDDDYEVWSQRGYALADSVEDGAETWSGCVYLNGDFEVQAGATLTIAPGTEVYFETPEDIETDHLPELRVLGQLLAEGTEEEPILFTSTRGLDAGEWGGIVFQVDACLDYEEGLVLSAQLPSSLDYVRIENAAYAIVLEDLGAPNLANLEFDNIEDDRHIFLKSDAVLPSGYWDGGDCGEGSFEVEAVEWDLHGFTRVVASTSDFNDAWVGVTDKIDVVVYGKLFTDGAPGDTVFFGPDEITDVDNSAAGEDWGGIVLTDVSNGSKLRWIDIGYAANPIFMFYPDDLTEIEHSRIHHFADVGIWAQYSIGQGGVVDTCVVERGEGLHPDLGDTGIYLDRADQFSVLRSTVSLVGRDTNEGGTGIALRYGQTFCETIEPPSGRQLSVSDNVVIGPGRDEPSNGTAYTGLRTEWICGSLDRDIDIVGNLFWGWMFAGLEFVQTADVQVTCNWSIENKRGADIYRDSDPTGSAIRFRNNKLEATEANTTLFALRTNDAVKTKLGPSQADRGINRLRVNQTSTKFIFENDATPADVLDATDNFWYADTLFDAAANADTVKIKLKLSPDSARVLVASYETDDTTSHSCWPDTSGMELSGMLQARRPRTIASDRVMMPSVSGPEEPTVLELGKPFPNPNRTGAVLSLAVPGTAIGTYEAEVFDIRGRRVWASRQDVLRAGRYRIEWDGRDATNQRVAAGVYFLRLSGPGDFAQIRKITQLR